MSERAGAARRLVSIEDVVRALASQCDGARKRDGRGFSRSDAIEGGRLCALKSRDMAWSVDDARKAVEIASRYSSQAGQLLGYGNKAREEGIESALRGGRVQLRDDVVEKQEPYNYACLSPGGKQVHFWRLTRVGDLGALARALSASAAERHGVRKIWFRAGERAALTLNGTKVRADRMEIDYNGTTRQAILKAASDHGFLLEPAVETELDSEVDGLRRHARAAWIHRGVREGRTGMWVVCDLERRHDPFSSEVKTALRRRFACLEHDDWNWYLDLDRETFPVIAAILRRHSFAVSDEIAHHMARIAAAGRRPI